MYFTNVFILTPVSVLFSLDLNPRPSKSLGFTMTSIKNKNNNCRQELQVWPFLSHFLKRLQVHPEVIYTYIPCIQNGCMRLTWLLEVHTSVRFCFQFQSPDHLTCVRCVICAVKSSISAVKEATSAVSRSRVCLLVVSPVSHQPLSCPSQKWLLPRVAQ